MSTGKGVHIEVFAIGCGVALKLFAVPGGLADFRSANTGEICGGRRGSDAGGWYCSLRSRCESGVNVNLTNRNRKGEESAEDGHARYISFSDKCKKSLHSMSSECYFLDIRTAKSIN
jgi:hypothetical protein